MSSATWNGALVAESDETMVIEGNRYFPPQTVRREFLRHSSTHTLCSWKGEANYYDLEVGGKINRDAAWYYPRPKDAAHRIRGYIAFWRGVRVEA